MAVCDSSSTSGKVDPLRRQPESIRPVIRNAVIHVHNEQPMLADLYALPSTTDVALLCTNLRMKNGKRPVFADHSESVFLFPLLHIRFVEIAPGSTEAGNEDPPALSAGKPVEPEPELEIDEDFLRRIRDA